MAGRINGNRVILIRGISRARQRLPSCRYPVMTQPDSSHEYDLRQKVRCRPESSAAGFGSASS